MTTTERWINLGFPLLLTSRLLHYLRDQQALNACKWSWLAEPEHCNRESRQESPQNTDKPFCSRRKPASSRSSTKNALGTSRAQSKVPAHRFGPAPSSARQNGDHPTHWRSSTCQVPRVHPLGYRSFPELQVIYKLYR